MIKLLQQFLTLSYVNEHWQVLSSCVWTPINTHKQRTAHKKQSLFLGSTIGLLVSLIECWTFQSSRQQFRSSSIFRWRRTKILNFLILDKREREVVDRNQPSWGWECCISSGSNHWHSFICTSSPFLRIWLTEEERFWIIFFSCKCLQLLNGSRSDFLRKVEKSLWDFFSKEKICSSMWTNALMRWWSKEKSSNGKCSISLLWHWRERKHFLIDQFWGDEQILFQWLFCQSFPLFVRWTFLPTGGRTDNSFDQGWIFSFSRAKIREGRFVWWSLVLLRAHSIESVDLNVISSMYTRPFPDNESAKIDHQVDLFEKQHSFINWITNSGGSKLPRFNIRWRTRWKIRRDHSPLNLCSAASLSFIWGSKNDERCRWYDQIDRHVSLVEIISQWPIDCDDWWCPVDFECHRGDYRSFSSRCEDGLWFPSTPPLNVHYCFRSNLVPRRLHRPRTEDMND